MKPGAKLARVARGKTQTDSGHEVIATTATMIEDLGALGLGAGDTVCVHSSVKALGHVIGGPRAIV